MKRKIIAAGLSIALLLCPMTVFATEDPIDTQSTEEPAVETQVTENESKPFISLGKDLSEEQLQYVLTEMGISKDDLEDYRVYYVTNEEEHEKLDSYIDPAVIGSVSLSCVMVRESIPGYGIRVTTRNIDYCTVSMYKNALLTAGVKNADVLVVGPYPISGTAALIGAWHAYEEMTGEELVDEAKDTALNEMIVTGEIVDSFDTEDSEKVQELIDYVKASVIAEGLDNPEDIKEVIENAETLFSIDLSDEQVESLSGVMDSIADLNIDPAVLLEQAGDLYDKYGEDILSGAKDAFNDIIIDTAKATIWDKIKGFIRSFVRSVKDYIQNI